LLGASAVGTTEGRTYSERLSGLLREVRVSKTVRYKEDFTPVAYFMPDPDTLALYHFGEGSGPVLKDSSGNRHDANIVGATWARVDGP
jgi:hypothetical protein